MKAKVVYSGEMVTLVLREGNVKVTGTIFLPLVLEREADVMMRVYEDRFQALRYFYEQGVSGPTELFWKIVELYREGRSSGLDKTGVMV